MTDFKGNLGNYKILKTEDNTETVWSEYFDEACHNLSGAYEETLFNYINGCNIPVFFRLNKNFTVLDVGFGVGLGLKALIDQYDREINFKAQLCYYSIELDESLLSWSLTKTLPFLNLERKELNFPNEKLIFYYGKYKNSEITIYVGDGRMTLPLASSHNLILPIDAIFQDAFSPKKNPTLWSVEWFSFLKSISSQEVKLSTYSSSTSIRKSLNHAGWAVLGARGFSQKKNMTKAALSGATEEEILQQMARSPSLEIRDK